MKIQIHFLYTSLTQYFYLKFLFMKSISRLKYTFLYFEMSDINFCCITEWPFVPLSFKKYH